MQQLLEAAFRPPGGADERRCGKLDGPVQRYAVLPKQTEDEIAFAEAHSRLDRVLKFLQRDIGYSFLDDARPAPGGSVRLTAPEVLGNVPWRAGCKSARLPRSEPKVVDDDARMIRIGPSAAKYAQYPDDLVLVSRFAALLTEATPEAADKVRHDTFYKTVLQGVRLMHLCDFNYSDVVLTLAYASTYFRSTFKAIGDMMSEQEAAHVCTLLIFLAHSFVLDETCPLRCWQRHIFRKYCTLKVLDAALFRLFHLRGFQLRLSSEEERTALSALLCSSNGFEGTELGDGDVQARGRTAAAPSGRGDLPEPAAADVHRALAAAGTHSAGSNGRGARKEDRNVEALVPLRMDTDGSEVSVKSATVALASRDAQKGASHADQAAAGGANGASEPRLSNGSANSRKARSSNGSNASRGATSKRVSGDL